MFNESVAQLNLETRWFTCTVHTVGLYECLPELLYVQRCVWVIFTGAGHSSSFLRSAEARCREKEREGWKGRQEWKRERRRLTKSSHTQTHPWSHQQLYQAYSYVISCDLMCMSKIKEMCSLTGDDLNSTGNLQTQSKSDFPSFSYTSSLILLIFFLPVSKHPLCPR